MSGNSKTLAADGLKIRCAANKVFAVAVPAGDKLNVTKRTDDLKVALAELHQLARFYPRQAAYLFYLPTATLVYSRTQGWPVPDLELLGGHVRNAIEQSTAGKA